MSAEEVTRLILLSCAAQIQKNNSPRFYLQLNTQRITQLRGFSVAANTRIGVLKRHKTIPFDRRFDSFASAYCVKRLEPGAATGRLSPSLAGRILCAPA
jgi:hypothetical protein